MLMHTTVRYKNRDNARCKPMDSGARPRGGRQPARARLRPGSGLPAPAPALRGHVRAASWPHHDLPAHHENDTGNAVRGEVASARGCAGEAEACSGHMAGHGQCGGGLCARCIKSHAATNGCQGTTVRRRTASWQRLRPRAAAAAAAGRGAAQSARAARGLRTGAGHQPREARGGGSRHGDISGRSRVARPSFRAMESSIVTMAMVMVMVMVAC